MSNINIYALDEYPENFDYSNGDLPDPTRIGGYIYGNEFNIDRIFSLGQLKYISDISINNISNNNFLTYDNANSSWVNKSPEDTILTLGITALASELNYNDLTLLGTAEASKVLTSDENGLTILPDTFKLSVGSSEDLQIHHDGTNSLIDNQTGQLRIAAEVASSAEILIGNASSTVLVGQDLTASGVIIGHKDNATALRVKGAAHVNDAGNADPDGDVQSYAGIFTNDVYNQASHAGTKNTRFITGGNLGMDVVTQSAHGLHLVAGDGTQTDGEILMASKNGLTINARVNPYAVTAPKRLLIDRVDKNTLDANNTSDVEISVNAGNLVISSNTEISSVDLTGQSVDLNLNSNKITNLANPTLGTDAANKAYVDEVAQGIISKPSVLAATTQNLAGTYDNGTLGVGGTLNLGTSATLDIDGVTTWSQYDGILVKDQTNAEENGRYYVSQVGDASTDWILTRCGYCDEADEIPGAYIFVASGTANEGTGWVQVVADPSTFVVGTDPISVYQFSSAGSAGAGAGLTQNGNVLDVNVDNSSIEIDVNDNLKIKAAGVTSAMLAGSIANSKLNQLTTANKVALSSMDIDGASELSQAITDSDLLIVDNGGTGINSSLLASRIPEYTFGKVTGDASITSAGSLSLTSTAITGQTAKTAINDNDIILIADSEDSNNLKKMTRANFVSGLAASSFSSNLVPDSANTYSLGSSAAEWSDLYLGDDSNIYFGDDQDVLLTHNQDDGLTLSISPTAGTFDPKFNLLSNSDGTNGPQIHLTLDSATPAVNDTVGAIIFKGKDNSGSFTDYGTIKCLSTNVVNGQEKGKIHISPYMGSFNNKGISIEGVSGSTTKVLVNIDPHNGIDSGLQLNSTLVTSLADELNVLDVSVENPSDNDVLTYTAANGLHWTAASGGASSLNELSDVSFSGGSLTATDMSNLILNPSNSTLAMISFGDYGNAEGIRLQRDSSIDPNILRIVNAYESIDDNSPTLELYSNASSAGRNSRLRFTHANNNATELGEMSGHIDDYLYSRIAFKAEVTSRNGSVGSDGSIIFDVATNESMLNVMKIYSDSSKEGRVNIATHNGTSRGLELGGALVTSTAAELNALDVSAESPSDNDVLTYTAANGLHWTAASGSSVDLTSIASNVLPDGSNTRSLGSADFEWSDLYLGDSSRIYLGNDQDVYLEHDPDDGIQLHMSSENAQEPALSIVHNSSSTNFQGPSLQLHNTSLDASTDIIGSVRFLAAGHHSSTISASGKGGGLDTGSDMAFYVCASGQNSSLGLEITGKNNTDGLKVRIPDHNGSTTGLVLGNTLVTASGLEINKLDGLTATTTELNLLDGGTIAQATTLQNTDSVIVNDSGLMKQVALSDVKTYIGSGTFEATAIELGDMLLNYSGSLTSQYLRLTMADNSSNGEPIFLIENDTTSSAGGKLSFSVKEANSNLVGDGDTLGTIEWRETESNGATAFWCHQVGKVLDHTNNYGSLELMVRSGSTSPVTALSIEGSAGGTLVDIEDHDGADSGLKLGGALVTSTAAELNALDISAESPSDNDVLTYTTANGLHWATASGGGGASAPTVITDSSGTNTTISTTSGIEEIHLISNGSNAVTITLPAAATAGSGYKYNIKQLGTANVTIDANGSETIDGSLTFVISSQYSSVTLVTDGSNWFVI